MIPPYMLVAIPFAADAASRESVWFTVLVMTMPAAMRDLWPPWGNSPQLFEGWLFVETECVLAGRILRDQVSRLIARFRAMRSCSRIAHNLL